MSALAHVHAARIGRPQTTIRAVSSSLGPLSHPVVRIVVTVPLARERQKGGRLPAGVVLATPVRAPPRRDGPGDEVLIGPARCSTRAATWMARPGAHGSTGLHGARAGSARDVSKRIAVAMFGIRLVGTID